MCKMKLQIHLSELCNLKCKHCYQGKCSRKIMSLNEYENILSQMWMPFTINLTGGEPLLVSNIKDYITVGLKYAEKIIFMTNGTLITETFANFLVGKNITVQISIDGTESTHDIIRGQGNYKRAMHGIKILANKGIRISVACTLHQDNYREVKDIVEVVLANGANHVWFDRYVPCAGAFPLSTDQFIEAMTVVAGEAERHKEVGAKRSMQFLFTGGGVYRCSALLNSLTIMPDGTVYPCRRMPINIGNCFTDTLKNIYDSNEEARQKIHSIPEKCSSCGYKERCRGGLKCLSYACGEFDKDINCFIEEAEQ